MGNIKKLIFFSLNIYIVDDTTDALAGVDPGVRFKNGKLVMRDELVEGEKLIEEEDYESFEGSGRYCV